MAHDGAGGVDQLEAQGFYRGRVWGVGFVSDGDVAVVPDLEAGLGGAAVDISEGLLQVFDGLTGLRGQRTNGAEGRCLIGELIGRVGEAAAGGFGGVAFPAGEFRDVGELLVDVFDCADPP
ncbi:hypothetical protein [Nocardia cyriacigeorgica]|uniref:hypothetical protein n=1 Tax=Nocardia cyriacigeorgica TaxID=135487 RepID=UPI002017501B|nr:hypothetical protein [Nocardia cyriacigeorgica]